MGFQFVESALGVLKDLPEIDRLVDRDDLTPDRDNERPRDRNGPDDVHGYRHDAIERGRCGCVVDRDAAVWLRHASPHRVAHRVAVGADTGGRRVGKFGPFVHEHDTGGPRWTPWLRLGDWWSSVQIRPPRPSHERATASRVNLIRARHRVDRSDVL